MQVFAKLPKLIVLRLLAKSLVVEEIAFPSGVFPKLELLELDHLENIMSLSIQGRALPNLEILRVYRCNFLSEDSLRLFHDLPRMKMVLMDGTLVHKGSHIERLRRWRQAPLVLNASRRFRYTLDLKKEEEERLRQKKIGVRKTGTC